jgi:hypothetical protein
MFGKFYRTQLGNGQVQMFTMIFIPGSLMLSRYDLNFKNILLPKDIVDDERVKIQQKGNLFG